MLQQFSDRNLQRNCCVAIESLRKSIDVLWGHLDTWVVQRLEFRDLQDKDWVQEQEVLWETLGVEAETCHVLANGLQYQFLNGRIFVSRQAAEIPDLLGLIHTSITSAWRFVKWSTSRWLTVGTSARNLVASLLMGVEDLVDFIGLDKSANMYFLGGSSRGWTRRNRHSWSMLPLCQGCQKGSYQS